MRTSTAILEITAIPDVYKDRMFFYGVDSVKDALKIFRAGYIPYPEYRNKRGSVVPGRTYVSGSLSRACLFANAEFGSHWSSVRLKRVGRYGYVFVIGRENLRDIYPNESTVGRFLQKTYDLQYGHEEEVKLSKESMDFLQRCWNILDRGEQKAIIYDESDAAPEIGKKLLKSLPDSVLLWILNHDEINLSNEGDLEFRALFRIDRAKLVSVDEKGSNFFDVAERVTNESQIV